MLALWLLKSDILAAGTAGGAHALTLQRIALRCAERAFHARGNRDHPAWGSLVAAVQMLLRHRSPFGDWYDDGARVRLLAFVFENADALAVSGIVGPVA